MKRILLSLLILVPVIAWATINATSFQRIVIPSGDGKRYLQNPDGTGASAPLPGQLIHDYDFEQANELVDNWTIQQPQGPSPGFDYETTSIFTDTAGNPGAPVSAHSGTKFIHIHKLSSAGGDARNRIEAYLGPGSEAWAAGDRCGPLYECIYRYYLWIPAGFNPGDLFNNQLIMGQLHGGGGTSPSLTVTLREFTNAAPYYWNISALWMQYFPAVGATPAHTDVVGGNITCQTAACTAPGAAAAQTAHQFTETDQWNEIKIIYKQSVSVTPANNDQGYICVFLNGVKIAQHTGSVNVGGWGQSDVTPANQKIGAYQWTENGIDIFYDDVSVSKPDTAVGCAG